MTLFDPLAAVDGHEPGPNGPREVIVYVGGGSRGNPGPSGYGVLVFDGADGRELASAAAYLGQGTHKVAAYNGLIAGLELANKLDQDSRVTIRMDSKLVIEQMSGRWKITHANIRSLAHAAHALTAPGRAVYEWVPHGSNTEVNALMDRAIDEALAAAAEPTGGVRPGSGALHHVEIWVAELEPGIESLGWLFAQLGFAPGDRWASGMLWRGAGTYLVLESGPDVEGRAHDRKRPGLNHLAFAAGSRSDVDRLVTASLAHGWTLLFGDRHPFAGGNGHYAAYLENAAGFEVELVASASG